MRNTATTLTTRGFRDDPEAANGRRADHIADASNMVGRLHHARGAPGVAAVARPAGANTLKASDLQCLSDSAYTTIVNRERGYKTWGLQLEAIIDANNAKAVGGK